MVFSAEQTVLESTQPSKTRPPVFLKEFANKNVLTKPGATAEEVLAVTSMIPASGQHRWFRSMSSSQALTLSVFGNLYQGGQLGLLAGLTCDRGLNLFPPSKLKERIILEYDVPFLDEPRRTNLDVLFPSHVPIAVECKLTEDKIGNCSRPLIKTNERKYESEYCDGKYRVQQGRKERCSLTEQRIRYWELVPKMFHWDDNRDYDPCPLNSTYQLVRNVLSACGEDLIAGRQPMGHCVLLYDERNPHFQAGGVADKAFTDVLNSLKDPAHLRRCSWQTLVNHLREKGLDDWFSDELRLKYGF